MVMFMGKIKQTTKSKRTIRKSKTYKDGSGKLHCKSCGAFISGRGKKK